MADFQAIADALIKGQAPQVKEMVQQATDEGIAPEEIPKIFDKFYRVKHPETRQVIGTGLGLSIVKGIIEAHRGSVEVESKPGAGTTFKVLLPTVSGSLVSETENFTTERRVEKKS